MSITKNQANVSRSEQVVLNKSMDDDFNVIAVELLEWSPNNTLKRKVTKSLKTMIDEVDATTTYVGEATVGTTTSEAKWRIMKIVESGTVTQTLYADGDDSFDNVWDNRTSLSYS